MNTSSQPQRLFEIRPARAMDAAAVGTFLQRLSEHSKRFRFHGPVASASTALWKLLCDVDGVHHQAWLAWADEGSGAVVVGEARFVVASAEGDAELAITVADDWQGSGLADAMLQQIVGAAVPARVSRLYGDVMDGNGRMRAFMRRHGFVAPRLSSGGVVRMSRALSPRSPQLGGAAFA